MKKLKFLTLIFILTFALLIPKLSYAQKFSLSISPPLLEIVIKPGKSILVAYSIQNFGDPVVLIPKIVSFEPEGDYGNIQLKKNLEGPVRFSLDNSEIKLNSPFFLKSKQKEQLLLRIRIPKNAPEGDFYYTLLLTTKNNLPQKKNIAAIAKATIGTNILITISETGKLNINPKIIFFDIIPRFTLPLGNLKIVDSFDKIPVILKIANTGKNYLKPQGKIELEGVFGAKATWHILPQNILSSSQRLIIASSESKIQTWKYKNKQVSLLLPQSFYLGKYNLRAKINFGKNSSTILTASTSFVAFPFKIGLLLIITGLIFFRILKTRLF